VSQFQNQPFTAGLGKQYRQVNYNVTLWCVRVTIITGETLWRVSVTIITGEHTVAR